MCGYVFFDRFLVDHQQPNFTVGQLGEIDNPHTTTLPGPRQGPANFSTPAASRYGVADFWICCQPAEERISLFFSPYFSSINFKCRGFDNRQHVKYYTSVTYIRKVKRKVGAQAALEERIHLVVITGSTDSVLFTNLSNRYIRVSLHISHNSPDNRVCDRFLPAPLPTPCPSRL